MITARFTATRDALAEGFACSTAALFSPRHGRLSGLWLLALGSTDLFWLARTVVINDPQFSYWLLVPALLLTTIAIQHPTAGLGWMVSTLFARQTETWIDNDATGLHVREGVETYRTRWPGVWTLTKSETTIFLTTNGATYILPMRPLDNPDSAFA